MGAIAAAVIMRKEKDLVAAFRRAGATSAATARSLDDLGLDETMAVRRLRSRAVLREAGSGRLYLDEPSWGALRRIRRRLALVILALIFVVLFVALSARWVG